MKEFLIATTSMFVLSASIPKDTTSTDTTKTAPIQKKTTKKAVEKKVEEDDSIFTLFNLTFKFQ